MSALLQAYFKPKLVLQKKGGGYVTGLDYGVKPLRNHKRNQPQIENLGHWGQKERNKFGIDCSQSP